MSDSLEKKFIKLLSTVKSFNDDEMMVSGVIGSDGSIDRHGDTINPKGWVLDNFQKNPVILLNHNYTGLPIGKAVNVRRKADSLTFDIQFSKTYELAKTAYELLKEGILNAWSVGFIPLEFGKAGGEWTINKMELLELSLVTVPANPNAVTPRQMKSLELLNNQPVVEQKAEIEPLAEPLEEKEGAEESRGEAKEVEQSVGESGGEVAEPVVEQKEVGGCDDCMKMADKEKIINDLLQSEQLQKAIADQVSEQMTKLFEAKSVEVSKSVESDEVLASDPQLLLLTALREELRAKDKETGKALKALNLLLNSSRKE
jgi:HK97 family phage prohead protease